MKSKMLLMSAFMALAVLITASCQRVEEKEVVYKEKKATVAVLVAEGFHDGEAYMPMGYLHNQGFDVVVIGIDKGKVQAYNSEFTINIEKAIRDVSVDDFDALVLPGGRGPAVLRENDEVIEFVKNFWETGKVTAAICHGPQVLITAGVLDGRTSTGVGGIKEELEEAGVNYLDESVVVDRNLITSRIPSDLNNFSKSIAEALESQL
jgi:protease I